uniref:protein GRAVITROPIC IN THE LIGHT 1-like n=1 Tax=Erigeron canadensis TaxID=72917 RepID=UPI001CB99690|nr:protein GRAVITROPIC IN THE LIGHT 1-like [Erigeron canadensis]
MFPNMLCGSCKSRHHQRNLKMNLKPLEPMSSLRFQYSNPYDMDPDNIFLGDVPLKTNKISNKKSSGGIKKNMANKICNFSGLINRITSSCLLRPLGNSISNNDFTDDDIFNDSNRDADYTDEDEEYSEVATEDEDSGYRTKQEMEMMTLIDQVFETMSYMKKSYLDLQEAHCPWDADRIRLADVAVVTELRNLGILMKRFRKSINTVIMDGGHRMMSGPTIREMVTSYESALEKLHTEVKSKAAEVDILKHKLMTGRGVTRRSNKSWSTRSRSRVACSSQHFQSMTSPCEARVSSSKATTLATPEVFETCLSSVKESSRNFGLVLLALMKSAHWDISATIKSIIATSRNNNNNPSSVIIKDSFTMIKPNHAKYALESYVSRIIFQGFDHETYNIDGSLSSLLNHGQFRYECFKQYNDMKSVDPMDLLQIVPTCHFGKFCLNKYLSIMHPKMEESLFGDLEQRRHVMEGNHPRSRFYRGFLALAKAVWLLHLIAFSLNPLPSHFEGGRGDEFHPDYMESVAKLPGGWVGSGGGEYVVGFPVSPGFKLGNGNVVKTRVYLVTKCEM